MEFYHSISKHYDEIFPLNPVMLSFISENLNEHSRILDVACATGNYSAQLKQAGHTVTGIDLDKEMISIAKQKNRSIDFLNMNMLEIDSFSSTFDLIFCIGNSLVHLESLEQVNLFIQKTYQQLNPNGMIKIQIIDYENIIRNSTKALPLIKTPSLEFIRNYKLVDDNRYVLFETELTVGEQKISNRVKLLTLTKNELESSLQRVGFSNINFYGNANKKERTDSSLPLVVSATKV